MSQKKFLKEEIASFDVDAQNCFTELCPDELPVKEGYKIVSELNKMATLASLRLGSKDAHNPLAIWRADANNPQFSEIAGDNVDVRWNMHAVVGTKGYELIDGLPKVSDYDFFVFKGVELDMHPYGACYHDLKNKISTGVIEFLKIKKINLVLVGGLALDYCVFNTVKQLLDANINVCVNLEASRGVAKETTEKAVEQLKLLGAIIVGNCLDFEEKYLNNSK